LPEERATRRLAAIMSADVVGYSRLMEADEAATVATLRRHRAELIDRAVVQYGGRIVSTAGDGLLCEFPSVVDAVQCAVDIQQAMPARNAGLPDDRRMQFRIGVNLGDVIVEGEDILGDGVNVAARLETLAEPGSICISDTVREHAAGKLPYSFEDLGEQRVKNIARPIRAWRVGASGPEGISPAALTADKSSIAILPFANMSGDAEQEYFADGITEDIITELSRFRNLNVIARNSTFTFKGQSVDVREAGRKLGVGYIVEGSIRKAGNRVRLTAQLVEVATGNHVWAERYDRDLHDIFDVQDELVASVVAQLGLSLRDAAVGRARIGPARSMTAYDHFLQGRAAWWRGDLSEGFAHLERALEADPRFAAAHAWLAMQYTYQNWAGTLGLSPPDLWDRARRHVEAALALDDRDPFVHMAASMAIGFSPYGDKARGLRHSDMSIALNPNDFDVMFGRAYHLAYLGRHRETLDLLDRLRGLNPFNVAMLAECYADTYYMMKEYQKTVDVMRGTDMLPQQNTVLAVALAQLGRDEEASACMAEVKRSGPEGFDPQHFARSQLALCWRPEDAENWREGFRRIGIDT
jgi:TolB-like protein